MVVSCGAMRFPKLFCKYWYGTLPVFFIRLSLGIQGMTVAEAASIFGYKDTSLNFDAWERLLRGHPNTAQVERVLHCLRYGVNIGSGSEPKVMDVHDREYSDEEAALIEKHIAKMLDAGTVIGPFDAPLFPELAH